MMYYLWAIPANFLVASILGYYILVSNLKKFSICISVFIIYFIIGHFNILNEAWIFNVTDRPQTTNQIISGFITSAIFSPVYVLLYKNSRQYLFNISHVHRSVLSWLWRIILADIVYLFLYILAGFTLQFVYPQLIEFYDGKLPSISIMIQTQVFVRGLLFIAVAFLILRTTNTNFIKSAALVGSIFSILGGISPLLPPNELMPQNIRIAHGVEVSISNFLYGIILVYILWQNKSEGKKTKVL